MKEISIINLQTQYKHIKKDIDKVIQKCLKHQQWILGPQVRELEEKIAQYLCVKHCISVASGSDALLLSLRALAIKLKKREFFNPDEKIITSPLTFTATGNAILKSGASPIFVDIDPTTYNLDTNKLEECFKKNSNVIGVIPVHLYGQACNMDRIKNLSQKYNLFVLEDVAQAFGGKWKNKKLGSLGDLGAFSFFPSKNLGGFGDGGMVATNSDELAQLIKILTKQGGENKNNAIHIGYNSRLDTLQAAVLLTKLKYVDSFNAKRRKITEMYNDRLSNIKNIATPHVPNKNCYHVYHQYTLRVLNNKRNALQKHLENNHIQTMIYYPIPLHKMKTFSGKPQQALPEAERACREILSLPIDPFLRDKEINYIANTCQKFSLKHP